MPEPSALSSSRPIRVPTATSSLTRLTAVIVACALFMQNLDSTVIATALPTMAHAFGIQPVRMNVTLTSYLLSLAVFIPASGWIADRFGTRTVFRAAIAVFTVGSILCGQADSLGFLVAARVLQGIGGAMMVPVGRLIVVRSVDKRDLVKAIATITWPAIAAPVIGPPIGGFITTYASWRWIFLLNVPFGIAALVATMLMVRNARSTERSPLDIVGFVLSGATLTCILYGTELASQQGKSIALAAGYVVAGIVLGVVAVRHAARHKHPLLDYTTLRVPTFSVTVITGSITRIGIGAMPYLLPLLFQIGFGMTAFRSGLLLLVSALGALGMKALTTPTFRRYGFRTTAIVAVAIGGIAIVAWGWLSPQTSLAVVLLVLFVYGATRSMQFSLLATLAYADIPPMQLNSANTLWNAAQQMTLGMGIAFGALS
ncbi:MAG TPA: DHA2 family efflux MFS transporter permease subunit, partial [Acetobacteraceae bacterium]